MSLNFPSSPSNGDTYENYIYDGSKGTWRINPQTPGFNLESLSDTTITTPSDGQALVYDTATSKWINETPASTLDSLTDTSLSSPAEGQALLYDSGTGNWINADVAGGVEVSATAPVSPSAGDLWWNSTEGDLFVYYNDGNSSQWVPASGPKVTVQDTAPTGYDGQLWLDSTDGSMYVYYTDPGGGSSSWIGAVSRSGGILQVVHANTSTQALTTSSSVWSSTNLSVSITPKSASSKMLVFVSQSFRGTGSVNMGGSHRILRDSTVIWTPNNSPFMYISAPTDMRGVFNMQYLDSPATTSSITYSTEHIMQTGGTNFGSQVTNLPSEITVMEVAG